jgi:hypothetical protein
MHRSFACASLLALMAGCTVAPHITTDVTRIAPSVQPAKPAGCDIQILTQSPTDRKFQELAIISAVTDTGTFTTKNLSAILPSLKEKACEVGADAIVIRNVEQGGTPTMDQYGSRTPTRVYCVAIRFLPAN